jgi:type I restriction enzyme R subunit
VHQYFGIKAAQAFMRRREGGILWHTQGSGKSIVMVLLSRWILATNSNARVVIITDRDELDQQIKDVFGAAGEHVHRGSSGADLLQVLSQPSPRLICSLVHKFGARGVEDFEAHIARLIQEPCTTYGELFVFVDECHRTQSGKLHRLMKAILREATFYGFTGTPLLTRDRATTLEVFGRYIHVYKYSEAVADEVVLDLVYEARDIDQRISSQEKVDQWFDAKTAELNPWQVRELKRYWGTMQAVLSSKSRINRIVMDIIYDITTQADLASERATAMLVASSIYEACCYFDLFHQTELKGRCAIITSYDPKAKDITKEETGANSETDKQFIYNTYTKLLETVQPTPGQSRAEAYEEQAKRLFVN